ncbi:hypothetical protein I5J66_18340, partial [Pseudomonas aeruginosa]|nr:hypothetical protein [Pseudomonas aeruginosa]
MTISIRGARVIDPASGLDQVGDLHIEAGKIVAIGAAPAGLRAQKTHERPRPGGPAAPVE